MWESNLWPWRYEHCTLINWANRLPFLTSFTQSTFLPQTLFFFSFLHIFVLHVLVICDLLLHVFILLRRREPPLRLLGALCLLPWVQGWPGLCWLQVVSCNVWRVSACAGGCSPTCSLALGRGGSENFINTPRPSHFPLPPDYSNIKGRFKGNLNTKCICVFGAMNGVGRKRLLDSPHRLHTLISALLYLQPSKYCW